jgi:hypothetical protein
MWFEYKKCLINLALVRRVFLTEDNSLRIVFTPDDYRNLDFPTESDLYEAYHKIKSAVVPRESSRWPDSGMAV